MLNNDLIRKIIMIIDLIVGKYMDTYRPAIIYTVGSTVYTIVGIIYVVSFMYMLWYSVLKKDC